MHNDGFAPIDKVINLLLYHAGMDKWQTIQQYLDILSHKTTSAVLSVTDTFMPVVG